MHRADAVQRGVAVSILVLIVITQFMRPSPRDGILFAVPAVAVAIDAVCPLPALPSLPPGRSRVGLLTVLVVAVVLVLTPRYGPADMLALALLGLATATTAWGNTDRFAAAWAQLPTCRRRPVRRAGIAWAIVLLTLALWELTAFLLGVAAPPEVTTPPSVSGALDPFFSDFLSRVVLVALWAAGGAYLLHRAMLAGHRDGAARRDRRSTRRNSGSDR